MSILMSFWILLLMNKKGANDQAGELDSYVTQKRVLDDKADDLAGSGYDHPVSSVEVINDIYKEGNETTNRVCMPKGRLKGISAAIPELVHRVLLNNVSGALRYKGASVVTKNGRTYGSLLPTVTLPSIFRQHPTPMSNRSLNVINVAQESTAEKDGLFQRCSTSMEQRIKHKD